MRQEEETEKENKWKNERRRKKAPRCTGSGSAPCPQHDWDGRTLKSGTRAAPVTPPLPAAVCSASAPANHTTENQHRSMHLRMGPKTKPRHDKGMKVPSK